MSYRNIKLEQFNNSLQGKKIAIIGLGVSNIPLLEYFKKYGAKITVFDEKDSENINEEILTKLNQYNIKYFLGKESLLNLKGFDIIFRSPSCMPTRPELVAEIKSGAVVTTEIEMVLKLTPSKVIGVTGTEGKTTTTTLINEIIKEKGLKSFLGGNMGNPLFIQIGEMTTEDIIILELSSFQLMNMEISPDISIITNMYPDHLNIHKTYEEYQNAKKNIFIHQNKYGITILNKDNEVTKSFIKDVIGKNILFSSKEKLQNGYIYDRYDETIKYCENGVEVPLLKKQDIKLRGTHNYENICAALAATSSLVDVETQIKAIKQFNGVEHRLEFVRELNGVKYYNDSIGTAPASTIAGLNAFDENIVLIAGGSDKGLDYTEIGEVIARKATALILTGQTAPKIEEATKRAIEKNGKNLEIYYCDNLEEAVNKSSQIAKKGEIVLLSPASASFDCFKNFIEKGNKYKEFVKSL